MYFRKETEPYMTIAIRSGGNGDDTASTPARVEIVQTGLLFTERGQTRQLAARVISDAGETLDLPVIWSSSNERSPVAPPNLKVFNWSLRARFKSYSYEPSSPLKKRLAVSRSIFEKLLGLLLGACRGSCLNCCKVS